MKRGITILAVLGLAVVLGLLAVAAPDAAATDAWTRFVHPTLGFSLSFPADWGAVAGSRNLIGVAVVGPELPGTNGFHMNVNVVSEVLQEEGTVERLEALAESQVALILNSYQRLRADRTTIAGRLAVLRYFTWKRNDGVLLYQMQLFTFAGRRAYVVTGTTLGTSPTIEREAALLQRIVTTFRPGR